MSTVRDFYATDNEYGHFELKAVPMKGYAPKKTYFVARVNSNYEVSAVDHGSPEVKYLKNWLEIEKICLATAQAAEEGRFCFTNGNSCIYVEGEELVTCTIQPVKITRTKLSDEWASKYIKSTRPHTSISTAESLRNHAQSKLSIEL